MHSLNDNFKECEKHADHIMDDVIAILDNASMPFLVSSDGTEIVIRDSGKTRDEIRDLVENSLDIPKIVVYFLLTFQEAKGLIFIRLQSK